MIHLKSRITAALVALATACSLLTLPVFTASAASISGWELVNNGGQHLEAELDTVEKHGGKASLRISYESAGGDNVYFQLRQYIPVKQNTSYTYGMWLKADKIGSVQNMISWGTRYNINSFGDTFGWKYFEFAWYSGNSTRAEFQFTIGSTTKNIWLDDIVFKENGTEANLCANPDFETGVQDVQPQASANPAEPGTPSQPAQASFKSLEESGNDFMSTRYMPVMKASGITVDGNLDDWDKAIPISVSGNDIAAKAMTMYDDEYFYIGAVVDDTVHAGTTGSMAWQNDSIQFTFGSDAVAYGTEFTASVQEDGSISIYSEQYKELELAAIPAKGRHKDDKTYYEIAVPWSMYGADRTKDVLLYNILVNDNDGSGRKFLEFASGIATGKSNKDFFRLNLLGADTEIFGSINCGGVQTDQKSSAGMYLVSYEKERTVNVTYPQTETPVTIKIPANSVYMDNFNFVFSEPGVDYLTAKVEYDGKTVEIQRKVEVVRSLERFQSDLALLKDVYLPELKSMMDACKEKGMSVDYELSDYTVIEFFIPKVSLDLENELTTRATYIIDNLFKLYAGAKENLTAYLAGEKTPPVTYKYNTSQWDIDGQTIWADMENSQTGEVSKRPMYSTGFNAFGNGEAVEYFKDMGFNTLANEIGINTLIVAPGGTTGWSTLNRKENTALEIVYEDESKQNSVLKITSKAEKAANKYLQFSQKYSVKPNTTYKFGLKVKAKNVKELWFSIGGWATSRNYLPDGDFDWKSYDLEYTTSDSQTSFEFFIFLDGICDEAYVDNVYVIEEGTNANLLKNGDFEAGRNLEEYKGMKFDPAGFDRFDKILRNAEEKDVSICLQIATHYYPTWTINDIEEAKIPGHFTGNINYTHERVREVTEFYLKNLLALLKNYKSLDSLILGNEPGYCTLGSDFYEAYFREYLKTQYQDDITKLNAVYGSEYQSFDEINFADSVKQGDTQNWLTFGIDLSKYEKTPIFYDWVNFNYSVYTDWATFLYNTCKKYAPEIKVHIKQLAGTWRYDHDYFRQWLRNGVNAEDIAEVTDINGCDAQGILNNSEQNISTKMRWYDYMTSIKNVPVFNSEDHIIPDNSDNLDPRIATWTACTTWQGAIHGCTANTAWVWSDTYTKNGLYGSMIVRPDAVSGQAKATLDLNRLGYEVKAINDIKAQVAVMDSLPSHCLDRIFENVSYNAWQSSCYSGQTTDFITEKQIQNGKLNQYKVLLVPKCDRVYDETVAAIDAYIKAGGRVIVFGEDSFKYDEYGNPRDPGKYADIISKARVVPITWAKLEVLTPVNREIRDMLLEEFGALGMTNVMLVDAETGEPVYNVEWESAELDGATIINVNNYEWESDKQIAVEINGVRVKEFTELRSLEKCGGSITVKPYQPVMLKIEQ